MGVRKIVQHDKLVGLSRMYRGRSITPAGGNLELEPQSEYGNTYIFIRYPILQEKTRSLIVSELARSGSNINHELKRSVEVNHTGTIEIRDIGTGKSSV